MNALSRHSASYESATEEIPTLAIWSMALGVFCLSTCGLTSVPAIVCGHLARRAPSRREGRFGRRLATAGLVSGYLGLVLLTGVVLCATRASGAH